jgi:hypothetical protein
MKSLVRPELPTAALRSSQATLAAVDNSVPLANRPESTYKSGKVVQTTGATSVGGISVAQEPHRFWIVVAIITIFSGIALWYSFKKQRDWKAHEPQPYINLLIMKLSTLTTTTTLVLLTQVALNAHAGRPMGTDDAGTAGANKCQIESWIDRDTTANSMTNGSEQAVLNRVEINTCPDLFVTDSNATTGIRFIRYPVHEEHECLGPLEFVKLRLLAP